LSKDKSSHLSKVNEGLITEGIVVGGIIVIVGEVFHQDIVSIVVGDRGATG
jgi:hypothetical protein